MTKKNEAVNPMFPVAAESGDNLPVSSDLAAALVETGNLGGATVAYLKFSKVGSWVFGRDDDAVDEDDVLAVNPTSFTIGWQGWRDGVPVEGPILPITRRAELPAEADLEAIEKSDMNGWNKILGVSLKTLSDGVDLSYNTSSYGGKQAITKLMKEVGLGIQEHPEAPVALVKLSSDSYKHAKYGTINSPIITVVGWADANGNEVEELAAA